MENNLYVDKFVTKLDGHLSKILSTNIKQIKINIFNFFYLIYSYKSTFIININLKFNKYYFH